MPDHGTDVETNDVTRAAKQIQAAATAVKGADPSGDLAGVGTALSGGDSASAAADLTTAWRTRFSAWHQDASDQHDEMVASATTYDATETYAENKMRNILDQTGRA